MINLHHLYLPPVYFLLTALLLSLKYVQACPLWVCGDWNISVYKTVRVNILLYKYAYKFRCVSFILNVSVKVIDKDPGTYYTVTLSMMIT